MKIRFYNIVWDTDGEDVDLPDIVEMDIEDEETDVSLEGADLLSDIYGWCIQSFSYEVIERKKVRS